MVYGLTNALAAAAALLGFQGAALTPFERRDHFEERLYDKEPRQAKKSNKQKRSVGRRGDHLSGFYRRAAKGRKFIIKGARP